MKVKCYKVRFYKICYVISDGIRLISDTAIVKAGSSEEAVEKLRKYIPKTGYDNRVTNVYLVEEFKDDVFSQQFKPL